MYLDQAKEVLKRLKNGEDFASLSRSYSVGPEAQGGGDMGHVFRGQLPGNLEESIFALEVGAISPVVESPFGFHIFQVMERIEAREPDVDSSIERIKEGIKNERIDAAYGPWLAGLRSRYEIEINKDVI